MPELITCGQNNCVHHVRFGSCAAVRVSVACKGRGKHKTFCDSFVPKPPPKIKKKQRDLTLWERYFGEADRLLALETAAPIAVSAPAKASAYDVMHTKKHGEGALLAKCLEQQSTNDDRAIRYIEKK